MSGQEIDIDTLVMPGSVAVVLPIIRHLGVREVVDSLCPMQWSKGATHGQVAEMLLLHILQAERRLPLYELEEWVEHNDIGPLLGCPAQAFNDDRVGRALEAFAAALPQLEAQLVARAVLAYRLPIAAVHWDFTNLTFTGAYEDVPIVTRGYRTPSGCRQIELSLAVDENGIPLRHEVVPGNAQPHGFIASTLQALQERLGRTDLLIIGDRGVICYDLVEVCQRQNARFIGPLQTTPAQREWMSQTPLEAFTLLPYTSLSSDGRYWCFDASLELWPQKKARPLPVRTLIIYSETKAQQDAQKRREQLERAEQRLEKIAAALNQGRYKRRSYAQEQLAKAVALVPEWLSWELEGEESALRLSWARDEPAITRARELDGRYLLITNTELPAAEVFAAYKRQHVVESNFRTFKSGLACHPIYLSNEQRIRGLVAIVILALLIYGLLELTSVRREVPSARYHKLTARAILQGAGRLIFARVVTWGRTTPWKLRFDRDQQRLWHDLGFPDPTTWLTP